MCPSSVLCRVWNVLAKQTTEFQHYIRTSNQFKPDSNLIRFAIRLSSHYIDWTIRKLTANYNPNYAIVISGSAKYANTINANTTRSFAICDAFVWPSVIQSENFANIDIGHSHSTSRCAHNAESRLFAPRIARFHCATR